MDKIQYKSYSLILLVLLFVVGCIILLFWVYDVCWPDHFTISHGQKIVGFWGYHLITVIFSSLFIGVALHEFTHGLTMSYFLGWKWDSSNLDLVFRLCTLFVTANANALFCAISILFAFSCQRWFWVFCPLYLE